jgi:NAD(P)-dependent dehydrogenase (short-subunit alcohol dehydrogenase family)/NAD(P)H-dependent FMN reductase
MSVSPTVRILLISGSARNGSTNSAVLRTAGSLAAAGVEAEQLGGIGGLPLFNPDDDLEGEPVDPRVAAMRQAVAGADALLICTPEYAGALPAALKNLLEWTIGDAGTYDKPVAWINAAGAAAPTGAADAHASLRKVLQYAGADIADDASARIPVARQDVDARGEIADPAARRAIATAVERLAEHVHRRGSRRARQSTIAAVAASRRVILITGCSSPQGIGYASARALARRGHAVHATVRDHGHDEGLRAGLDARLTIHHLDLLDQATVSSALAEAIDADGPPDVLINNAGYGLIGGVEQVRLDRARAIFETNLFATLALTQEILPLMRRRRSGHVINVSTIFDAGLCLPALGYYVGSKAALESVGEALAVEVAPWNIRVTNFQAGPVTTELSREWGDRLAGAADPRPGLSDELYQWVLGGTGPEPQSPDQVAEALCELVESEAAPLALQSGSAAREYAAGALHDPTRANELGPLLEAFGASSTARDTPGD